MDDLRTTAEMIDTVRRYARWLREAGVAAGQAVDALVETASHHDDLVLYEDDGIEVDCTRWTAEGEGRNGLALHIAHCDGVITILGSERGVRNLAASIAAVVNRPVGDPADHTILFGRTTA